MSQKIGKRIINFKIECTHNVETEKICRKVSDDRKKRVWHVKIFDVLCPRIDESEMRPASEEVVEC